MIQKMEPRWVRFATFVATGLPACRKKTDRPGGLSPQFACESILQTAQCRLNVSLSGGFLNSQPTRVRYVVLFGLCLAAGLAYVHRGCLGVVESTVRSDLKISKDDMGWAFGLFFWAYALFQIPTGLLVDRIGPRRSLLIFGLLGAITMALTASTLLTDSSTGFAILLLARLLMGIAQAGLFPASTRAISIWIPLKRRASAAGTLQACMALGGAIGAFSTARLMGIVTWHWIFLIYSIPGIIWSAWFFAWYRDRPDEHRSANEAERTVLRQPPASLPKSSGEWFVALTSLPIILLCLQQLFRAGASTFWFSWCPTFFQEAHGLEKQAAGELSSLPIFGFMLGSIVGGIVADWLFQRTGSRRISRCGTAICATFLGVSCFVLAFLLHDFGFTVAVVMLVLGAFLAAGGNSCAYTVAMDLGGRNLAAVFGAMNMFGNFGSALFTQIAPKWTSSFGPSAVVLLVAGSYFVGMLLWIPLRPDAMSARRNQPIA